jgi:hypothetical protein
MKIKRWVAHACAGAAMCLGGTTGANAYTYNFYNCLGHTVNHVWMHTVSAFCHDVDWYGSVPPKGSLTLHSASICLVDAVEVDGARVFSSPIGVASTTFTCCGTGGGFGGLCPSVFMRRHKAH